MPGNVALILKFLKDKGFLTSEFFLAFVVLSGADFDTVSAIMSGGAISIDHLKEVVSALHGQPWQDLAIKAALAGLYTWYRRDIKKLGLELEIERVKAGQDNRPI